MNRRDFFKTSAAAAVSTLLPATLTAEGTPSLPTFPSDDLKYRRAWDTCIVALQSNVQLLPTYKDPVLIEGAQYGGIWMECAPQESLVYSQLARYFPQIEGSRTPLAIARANHEAFFHLQRPDGQFPAYIWRKKIGFGQIQMVVPLAATTWELSHVLRDEAFLAEAYDACSRWDAWLLKYRNTRGTGLTEGFCTYDCGHDYSPRWRGMANACPGGEARNMPTDPTLPWLSPDLSATTYGARVALTAMAKALGKQSESDHWAESAEHIRRLIIEKLYSPEDSCFFDVRKDGSFNKVRGDALTRVLGEHVLKADHASDRKILDDVLQKQIFNPGAFWSPYPLPSIALNDPTFVRPVRADAWAGASQPLTALRTLRWMDFYGHQKEFRHMMHQWVEALTQSSDMLQQIDPITGEWSRPDKQHYSPAALVYMAYIDRLQTTKAPIGTKKHLKH